jgi:hypothetical protein
VAAGPILATLPAILASVGLMIALTCWARLRRWRERTRASATVTRTSGRAAAATAAAVLGAERLLRRWRALGLGGPRQELAS